MRTDRRAGLYGGAKKYTWEKYNAAATTTYYWNKYNISKIYTGAYTLGSYTYPSFGSYPFNARTYYVADSISIDASGALTLVNCTSTGDHSPGSYTISDFNGKFFGKNTKSTEVLAYGYGDVWYAPNDGMNSIRDIIATSTTGRGNTSYGEVSSTSYSLYPSNGASGSYWYVYSRSVVTYAKGSTSYGSVTSADPDAFPANGRHTDGYWYVLIE